MKPKRKKPEPPSEPRPDQVEIRKDLQDPSKGKDLSYLNELPQMGGYEGVKAGAPPPKEQRRKEEKQDDEH